MTEILHHFWDFLVKFGIYNSAIPCHPGDTEIFKVENSSGTRSKELGNTLLIV